MAWYRNGTVAVTNGSAIVTGTNTDFVSNTQTGEGFIGPNGLTYEIASVVSATQLTLADPYTGPSGAGQSYKIQPTASFARDLGLGVSQLLSTFGSVRDGVGQGMFPDGVAASPGLRFAADQDTGLRRSGNNSAALVAGGVDRLVAGPSGATVAGRISVTQDDTVGVPAPTLGSLSASSGFFGIVQAYGLLIGTNSNGNTWLQTQRIDGNPTAYDMLLQPSGGNLLVGATSGGEHTIAKAVAQGTNILRIQSSAAGAASSAAFAAVNVHPSNAAGTALYLGKSSQTDRSINAAGTINASGADYAEYVRKALNCGTILKGDVCGIDRNGELVRTWSDAVRYVVKSTDPSLVGGDTWAAHLPPKPDTPGAAPIMPVAPIAPAPLPASPIAPVREDGETDETFLPRSADFFATCLAYEMLVGEHAAYREALAAYPELLVAHQTAYAAWQADVDAYEADLHTWEGQLETARQGFDRIAFSGQVPVNVDDATLAACEAALADGVAAYLVAVARGAGIGVVAVREADMTLAQYMKRVGAVWAIREGRPWIDVQHG